MENQNKIALSEAITAWVKSLNLKAGDTVRLNKQGWAYSSKFNGKCILDGITEDGDMQISCGDYETTVPFYFLEKEFKTYNELENENEELKKEIATLQTLVDERITFAKEPVVNEENLKNKNNQRTEQDAEKQDPINKSKTDEVSKNEIKTTDYPDRLSQEVRVKRRGKAVKNLQKVYSVIQKSHSSMPIAVIERKTEIKKATVNKIVSALVKEGMVQQFGKKQYSSYGRTETDYTESLVDHYACTKTNTIKHKEN